MKTDKRQVNIPTRGDLRHNYATAEKKPAPVQKYLRPLIAILLVIVVIYLVFFSNIFQVGRIVVSGKTTLPEEEIIRQVNQAIASNFAGRNVLFISTNQIADFLTEQNYQFAQVKVERTFINGLKVSIKEKQPSVIWKSGAGAYVLSDDGRAIADNIINYSDLPVIDDSANLPVKLGDKVAPNGFVEFVLNVVSGLKQRGINVVSMEVPDTTSELYAKIDKGYVIKFDTNNNALSQLDSLDSVLKTISKQNKKPSEYVDLRIDGRVFYK